MTTFARVAAIVAVLLVLSSTARAGGKARFIVVEDARLYQSPDDASASIATQGELPLRVLAEEDDWYEVETVPSPDGHCVGRDLDLRVRGYVRASDALDVVAAGAGVSFADDTSVWLARGSAFHGPIAEVVGPTTKVETAKIYRLPVGTPRRVRATGAVHGFAFAAFAEKLVVGIVDQPVRVKRRDGDKALVVFARPCARYRAWVDAASLDDELEGMAGVPGGVPGAVIGGVYDAPGTGHRIVVHEGAKLLWPDGAPAGTVARELEVTEPLTHREDRTCAAASASPAATPVRWCFPADDVKVVRDPR